MPQLSASTHSILEFINYISSTSCLRVFFLTPINTATLSHLFSSITTPLHTFTYFYILLHTPSDFLEAGQYCSQVHCSDGVVVPPEISNDLSLSTLLSPT